MSIEDTEELQAAHRHFASYCFNQTWSYIKKPARSEEDDLAMLNHAIASLWHWSQRADREPENLAVGYWQVSYVFSLLGSADLARRYAVMCKDVSEKLAPFYMGEAYQALASAEKAAGNRIKMQVYLKKAEKVFVTLTDEEEKEALRRDLDALIK